MDSSQPEALFLSVPLRAASAQSDPQQPQADSAIAQGSTPEQGRQHILKFQEVRDEGSSMPGISVKLSARRFEGNALARHGVAASAIPRESRNGSAFVPTKGMNNIAGGFKVVNLNQDVSSANIVGAPPYGQIMKQCDPAVDQSRDAPVVKVQASESNRSTSVEKLPALASDPAVDGLCQVMKYPGAKHEASNHKIGFSMKSLSTHETSLSRVQNTRPLPVTPHSQDDQRLSTSGFVEMRPPRVPPKMSQDQRAFMEGGAEPRSPHLPPKTSTHGKPVAMPILTPAHFSKMGLSVCLPPCSCWDCGCA